MPALASTEPCTSLGAMIFPQYLAFEPGPSARGEMAIGCPSRVEWKLPGCF